MVVIPNLVQTPFHRIDVSFLIPIGECSADEDFTPSDRALSTRIQGDRPVFVTLEMGQEIGETVNFIAWLALSFEKPPSRPERARLAGEPAIQDRFPFSLDKWEECDPDSIWDALSVFVGRILELRIDSSFSIDRDSLPSESLVASMIGLRTKAGEEQFLLSGAQFTVRGFPDDTISWYLKPGSDSYTVAGNVSRDCVDKFHSESVSDAIQVVEARFNRVVRAQSSVKAHAST
jgi:hypothetical protein